MIKGMTSNLLTLSEFRRAEILGRAMHLAHRFSATVPTILQHARPRIDVDAVRLEILDAQSILNSDAVQSRLRKLAKSVGLDKAEIVEVDG